ncbi:CubicO group peptidase, beta-lactamase class C family [Prauserella marina]|uniref:CubicO group peptidase, beta-lactamase class C family n=1 Tax=Prauserella marina TaxID=530584 RepID=A0A1G6XJA5_9PSEU|nr:serine hydrolase domain-containing protein [Prauserella marina]PWV72549.1 CubicO group peptidase (beta-lactamase class C family) [Prauserella marina]SDD77435.1 CubicO group peptidase, beta-lactamase class C family [Prauserella marina]
MYRYLTALLLGFLMLGGTPAEAREPAAPPVSDLAGRVAELIGEQLRRDRIPGAVVTVVAGGKTVLSEGYGLAEVSGQRPMDPGTALFAASEAKMFTAVAAAQLITSGRIDPDADVNRYLSDFQIEDTFPGEPVTMNHLLTHTAGFDSDYVGFNSETGTGIQSLGENLAEKQPKRVRAPGRTMAYDNYGVALAGHLVEEVSGKPFDRYLADHVFGPLGMDDSTVTQPTPPAIAAKLAGGYRPDGTDYVAAKGQHGPWTPTGAGAIMTAADMGRFMTALLEGDSRLGDGVAELVTRQHFTADERVPGIAYLMVEGEHGEARTVTKDGDLPGFHHETALVPEHGVGVYVGFNGDGVADAAFHDAKTVRDTVLDHLLPAKAPSRPGAVPGDMSSFEGTYRASATSEYSLAKVTALTTPVTVEAVGGTGIRTSGVSIDPAKDVQEWTHVGAGEFAELDGTGRLVFDRHGNLVSTSGPEAMTYVPLAWYQNPTAHLVLFGLGGVGLLTGLLWFPIAALIRRKRGESTTTGRKVCGIVTWSTCAVGAGFLAGFFTLVADGNAMNETILVGSPLLTVLPYLPSAMLVTLLAMLAFTVVGPVRKWWNRWQAIGYVALTLATVAFLGVCVYYNLLAIGDTVSPGGFHAS